MDIAEYVRKREAESYQLTHCIVDLRILDSRDVSELPTFVSMCEGKN
jgi:hypothetical protein